MILSHDIKLNMEDGRTGAVSHTDDMGVNIEQEIKENNDEGSLKFDEDSTSTALIENEDRKMCQMQRNLAFSNQPWLMTQTKELMQILIGQRPTTKMTHFPAA